MSQATIIQATLTTKIITVGRQEHVTTEDLIARIRDLRHWLSDVELDNAINPEDGIAYNTDDEENELDRLLVVVKRRSQCANDAIAAAEEAPVSSYDRCGIRIRTRATAIG